MDSEIAPTGGDDLYYETPRMTEVLTNTMRLLGLDSKTEPTSGFGSI